MNELQSGMEHVRCDACGSDDTVERYRLKLSSIVSCRRCGLSYITPQLSSSWMERKLQGWADQDVLDRERLETAFSESTVRLYGRYLSAIRKHRTTAGNRLLDIGCSTGAFMKTAQDAGWDAEGVEIGRSSSAYAGKELGLNVHNTSLDRFEVPGGAYDLVSMLEVIEHLRSPSRAIGRAGHWLKEKGLLIVSTPNFDSLYRRIFGAGWWVINCEDEHITFFNPGTLRSILVKNGFDVVHEQIRSIDIAGMFRALSWRNSSATGSAGEAGYYASREGKSRLKRILSGSGLLGIARGGMRLCDQLFSRRWSPLYGLGEQIVMIGRKSRQ